jgi:lysozyme
MIALRTRVALVLTVASLTACMADADFDQLTQDQVVCARGGTLPGIDVSFWQGTINWDQVRGAGVRYAFIRAYYGANTRDSQFTRNWREARRVGLLRGAYQWFKPLQDPTAQANAVINAVGRLGPGDLPVVVDVEEPPADGIPSPSVYASRLRTWYDRVRAGTGRAPIIYSGKYYWEGYLRTTSFASAPLWHPQYTSATCPNIANQWNNWTFWQYTSTGRVAGIAGNVDRNRFNGTMADLNRLAGIVPAVMDAGTPVRDVPVARPADVPRDTPVDRGASVDVVRDVTVDRAMTVDVASDRVTSDDAGMGEDDAGFVPDDVTVADDVDEGDASAPDDTPGLGQAGYEDASDESQTTTGEPVEGGCSCSTAGGAATKTSSASALLLALTLALFGRRRAQIQTRTFSPRATRSNGARSVGTEPGRARGNARTRAGRRGAA